MGKGKAGFLKAVILLVVVVVNWVMLVAKGAVFTNGTSALFARCMYHAGAGALLLQFMVLV